ncbi:MAG: hypothetical protein ACI4M3_02100 [Acutalibacteraceae bacterium]
MKKFAVVLFSALLALSFTACGGSDKTQESSAPSAPASTVSTDDVSEASPTAPTDESKSETPTSSTDESKPTSSTDESKDETLFKKYAELSKGDVLYADMMMSVTISGTTTEVPMIMARDGEKAYLKTAIMGETICSLYDGTNTYMLDEKNKIAYKTNGSSVDMDDTFDDNYKLLDSGTTDYNGTSCTFEKYDMDGTESTMYFDADGKLIAFTSSANATDDEKIEYVYTVNAFTNEIPEGLLAVPSDYTIQEYSTDITPEPTN